MRSPLLALALLAGACAGPRSTTPEAAEASSAGHLLHVVAFDLQLVADAPALVEDCRQLLSDIPGVARLTVGQRGSEFDREANDQVFDVLLIVEFEDRAAHDAYQVHEQHQALVQRWVPRMTGFDVKDAWIE